MIRESPNRSSQTRDALALLIASQIMQSKALTKFIRGNPGVRMVGKKTRQAGRGNSNPLSCNRDLTQISGKVVQGNRDGRRISRILIADTQPSFPNRYAIGPGNRRARRNPHAHGNHFSQSPQRGSTIRMLRARFPGRYNEFSRPVNKANRGFGLVSMLPAGSADAMGMDVAFG